MRRAMTKMFKIALPDGSVREMPEGSTPADVAAAVRFLASEEAGYVTGHVLTVDGGWTAR